MGTWDAAPSEARWYGEVIGSLPGEDITYVDGYSAAEDEPDVRELIPPGWVVDSTAVTPTLRNPQRAAWQSTRGEQ